MHSPETRKKISEARKAFFLTPEGDQERKRKSEEAKFQDKVRRYIPDVIVTLEDLKFLIEIKPSRLRNKDRNIQKAIAAKQYCLKHGVEYQMLSEGGLWRFILTYDPETLFHLPEKFQNEVLSIINRIGSKLIA